MNLTRRRFTQLAGTALATSLAAPALAQSKTKLKMILNWRYQGPQAWFFLAQDRGYFDEVGIDMVMDQGNGSGAAVGQVAGGAYDIGFGDVNALIQLAATNPDEAPICVYQMYNKPPFTVAVLQSSDIMDAKDLEDAVRAYASESEGFTRSKVCFSDNWFSTGRWLKYLHDVEEAREAGKAKEAELLKGLADWVTDRHPLCRHITPGQVTALLAANLVSPAEIEAAGLRP